MFACSSDDTSNAKGSGVGRDQDASTSRANNPNDKGGTSDAGRADTAPRDGGNAGDAKKGSSSTTKHQQDAGASHASSQRDDDAGTSTATGSMPTPTMDGDDAGVRLSDSESCCIAHAKPGCNDSDVQRCVCDKLDTCCTQAWTAACTYIVNEKFCQAGVRDCVCGSRDGQWQQSACCNAEWTSTCDDVAQIKCGATVGCK